VQIQCPGCSKVVEVPEVSAGQVVACPACGGQMQVPETAPDPALPTLPAAPQAPQPTKQCPYCGETVLAVATKCKHCQEEIPEGGDVESIRRRLAAKEEKLAKQLASGGLPEIPYLVGGKFRVRTMVAAGIALVGLVMVIIGVSDYHLEELIGLGIMPMIISGVCFLVALINDCTVPSSSARKTPVKGLKAFLGAIRVGRYKYAYACLLDGDKDDLTRTRRPIHEVKVERGEFNFKSLEGFKRYWKGLAGASGAYMRRVSLSGFSEEQVNGDCAVVSASVKIESYPWPLLIGLPFALVPVAIVIMLVTKRETVGVSKLLRKVNGQWCVVNGELDSLEDRAIDVAAELAAR